MPETRDLLAELAAEEAAEAAAADEQHEANQAAQREADAAKLAAAADEPEPEESEEDDLEDEPEERLFAGKYKTVEEMERAYIEAESKIGQLGNEIGQVRQMVERQQGAGQQAAPAQQQVGPDGQPVISKEEMDEWMVEDPVAATFYLASLAARQQAEETHSLLAPVLDTVNNNAAAAALEQVKRELGPDGEALLNDHREVLIAAMEADRGHFVDPQTRVRHMKEAVLAAAWESGNLPTRDQPSTNGRRRGQSGRTTREDVHVEGGSGAQPARQGGQQEKLSPEEEELASLTTWRPPVDEMGIPLPRGPLG